MLMRDAHIKLMVSDDDCCVGEFRGCSGCNDIGAAVLGRWQFGIRTGCTAMYTTIVAHLLICI